LLQRWLRLIQQPLQRSRRNGICSGFERCKQTILQLFPPQAAWIAENVPQCGYCQPGQILSAVALLKAKRRPTGEDIDAVLDANLCRCGTYPRIRRAIGRVVAALQEGAEDPR